MKHLTLTLVTTLALIAGTTPAVSAANSSPDSNPASTVHALQAADAVPAAKPIQKAAKKFAKKWMKKANKRKWKWLKKNSTPQAFKDFKFAVENFELTYGEPLRFAGKLVCEHAEYYFGPFISCIRDKDTSEIGIKRGKKSKRWRTVFFQHYD